MAGHDRRDDGLVGIPRAPLEVPGFIQINMDAMESYYFVVLAFSPAGHFRSFTGSFIPPGLTVSGIRDSETRTACIGISVRKYRLLSFTLAGLYAGLAGALLPPLESTVTPRWPIGAILLSRSWPPFWGEFTRLAGPIVGSALFYLLKDIIVGGSRNTG